MKNIIIKTLLFSSLLIIYGCPMDSGSTTINKKQTEDDIEDKVTIEDTDKTIIESVKSIYSTKDGDNIIITWNPPTNYSSFKLYRTEGNNPIELIASNLTALSYTDNTFSYNVNITYAIKVSFNNKDSELSEYTTALRVNNSDLYVKKLEASKLEYNDKVLLTWNPVRGAESYKIYKYKSKTDINPVINTSINNTYSDLVALNDTPYLYRVSWIANNNEYGHNQLWAMGIKSSEIDVYENNNTLPESTLSSIFHSGYKPIIYSLKDTDGERYRDVDYYTYNGESETNYLKIGLESGFPTNTIKIDIISEGVVVNTELLNLQENNLSINYKKFTYKLYTVGSTDFISKYNITISNSPL